MASPPPAMASPPPVMASPPATTPPPPAMASPPPAMASPPPVDVFDKIVRGQHTRTSRDGDKAVDLLLKGELHDLAKAKGKLAIKRYYKSFD